MSISVADLRQNYTRAGLSQADLAAHPVDQFEQWFQQAVDAELVEPNAMTLATASPEGIPSARIVLLKQYDQSGFVFYTNYDSVKGQQLLANPHAALVFWWAELERQVRIQGQVEQISPSESDQYFHSRPRGSQLGAWASPQSQIIGDRTVLENNLAQLETQYQDQDVIPRPPHWGGFRVVPEVVEFWQGRPNRLHDRLCYRLKPDGSWKIERLAP